MKKLLITLGCSYTEGVGCWGNLEPTHPLTENEMHKFLEKHGDETERFHTHGFPPRLAHKLKYDKVINIGLGGASTSGNLKSFIEKFENETYKDYQVLVYWYLPEPSRFSFYSALRVHDFMPGAPDAFKIEDGYVDIMEDTSLDPFLEQLFYVKCLNQICQNKNWKLLVSPCAEDFNIYVKECQEEDKDYWMLLDFSWNDVHMDGKLGQPGVKAITNVDMHPNEIGYEMIADSIFLKIKSTHPELLGECKDYPTVEWKGNYKNWG